jgi:hypothetical protein
MVKGTVNIQLKDYHTFLEASQRSTEQQENLTRAAKELQVFLDFICNQVDIEDHINAFNRQSRTAEIKFINGRARIEFKDAK